eukprot:4649350-Prymnesium_polylepis.1
MLYRVDHLGREGMAPTRTSNGAGCTCGCDQGAESTPPPSWPRLIPHRGYHVVFARGLSG